MGDSVPLAGYISPVTNFLSATIEKLINSHNYTILYGIPILFGVRQIIRYNKLAKLRFSDIGYQIKRADSIGDRWTACKYFFIGTIIIPISGCIITYKVYDNYISDNYKINRLILNDLTKNIRVGIRASNDVQSERIKKTMELNSGISDSLKQMSKELKEDANKVKNKLGIT